MLQERKTPAALAAALDEFAESRSAESLAVITRYAESGWPQAQSALGLAYAKGTVVAQDFKTALELFHKAAHQNDAGALYYIGYAYLSGSGVEADPVAALAWFIVAATRGHDEALVERDRGLAGLGSDDRHRAINLARNLGPALAAGWSRDAASGIAVWLPSWYRDGSYALKIGVSAKDGYADGYGRIELKTSAPGRSDRAFEGRFSAGHYFGASERASEVRFLDTDDFLYRLPASKSETYRDIAFWLRVDFGVDFAADPCYVATNQTPDLVAAVPEAFPVLDDESAKSAMSEAWRLYQETCPQNVHAAVTVVPPAFERQRNRFGHLVFAPQLATASFYGKRGEELSIGNFENRARQAHEAAQREAERQRDRAARDETRRQAEDAAPGRGNPDVRGLRLGMTLAEVRAHFEDEVAEWEPPWQPDRVPPPYTQFEQAIRLSDGARISASFTSPINGSVLFAFSYEQDLRDGPPADELTESLAAKYGEPDSRGGGGVWWSYKLVSRVEETLGAFMQVHFRVNRVSNRVEYLRLVVNDAGFGSHDEHGAHAAKREAQQRTFEAGKSDKPRF